jgi:hypothetical protein
MNLNQCPQCGGPVVQDGADMNNVYYHCSACGAMTTVPIGEDGNGEAVYAQRKREILNRLHMGFLDWRVTQGDRLYTDLNDFITRYELAQQDIQMQMGLVACITRGFNMMDAERVKQCQNLFKMTEKMYKIHLKTLKKQMDPKLYESVSDYKEARAKYKKCLNQYRNTKLAWKLLFTVVKKFVPMGLGL